MGGKDKLEKLIEIIEKLEIKARKRDNQLHCARELIETIQNKQEVRQQETYMFTKATAVIETVPQQIDKRTRDRSLDIINGINPKLGDQVKIISPRAGHPNEGIIVGKTSNDVIKVEGRIKIGDHDITKIVRRIPDNVRLVPSILV